MPNPDIRWSVPDYGNTFPIYAGRTDDMDRVAEYSVERDVATMHFGGDAWQLEAGKSPVMKATTGAATGSQVFTAVGDAKTFGASKNVSCIADRHRVLIHAESRKDFVLFKAPADPDVALDLANAEKIGQFTSENDGLKRVHVSFEGDGETLPLDVQVFLSWVARHAMETRVLSSSWRLSIFLIILVPFLVLYFLGYI
ncbi:hypothetical protein [Corynebacterium kalidii]|uniref:Uncharacterized protein n=1 Tax=Corynebacterium kalidii TaxID=2931982 RepID=A0A9X1WH31_9CORY|nr:hypothetical protein [Corynebacterium kalidii]MCJ7858515.1 hypothetical protein [Corynebacterium kalidii]